VSVITFFRQDVANRESKLAMLQQEGIQEKDLAIKGSHLSESFLKAMRIAVMTTYEIHRYFRLVTDVPEGTKYNLGKEERCTYKLPFPQPMKGASLTC